MNGVENYDTFKMANYHNFLTSLNCLSFYCLAQTPTMWTHWVPPQSAPRPPPGGARSQKTSSATRSSATTFSLSDVAGHVTSARDIRASRAWRRPLLIVCCLWYYCVHLYLPVPSNEIQREERCDTVTRWGDLVFNWGDLVTDWWPS